ncbi:hypothetical protein CMV_008042 [Castanea mollissima]|uniref:Uncharacterized protein n=1 Tax=Castanea mollissima TaxID=60419 RepID=A0A8J4RMC2_9ROSI|nr:hypothetical protein CMV_008042 [Castanea mollissima]
MASMLGFLPNHSLYSRTLWAPSVSINHFVASPSHTSTVSYLSSNNTHQLKLKHFPQPQASSSEGVPGELIEDSKFVPLNAEDPRYGPPVSSGFIVIGF